MPAGYKYRYQYLLDTGEITVNPKEPVSESRLGRVTNYKVASPISLDDLDIILPVLDAVPSYIHPDTALQNIERFNELKKQISYVSVSGVTNTFEDPLFMKEESKTSSNDQATEESYSGTSSQEKEVWMQLARKLSRMLSLKSAEEFIPRLKERFARNRHLIDKLNGLRELLNLAEQ